MFVNGRTAMEGLSGSGSDLDSLGRGALIVKFVISETE
jgi:hypothetical protein